MFLLHIICIMFGGVSDHLVLLLLINLIWFDLIWCCRNEPQYCQVTDSSCSISSPTYLELSVSNNNADGRRFRGTCSNWSRGDDWRSFSQTVTYTQQRSRDAVMSRDTLTPWDVQRHHGMQWRHRTHWRHEMSSDITGCSDVTGHSHVMLCSDITGHSPGPESQLSGDKDIFVFILGCGT